MGPADLAPPVCPEESDVSRRVTPATVDVEDLIGMRVVDTEGARLGRIYDLWAEREGDDLCVTALVVGSGNWRARFGWGEKPRGKMIPWTDIVALGDEVTVRRDGAAVR